MNVSETRRKVAKYKGKLEQTFDDDIGMKVWKCKPCIQKNYCTQRVKYKH